MNKEAELSENAKKINRTARYAIIISLFFSMIYALVRPLDFYFLDEYTFIGTAILTFLMYVLCSIPVILLYILVMVYEVIEGNHNKKNTKRLSIRLFILSAFWAIDFILTSILLVSFYPYWTAKYTPIDSIQMFSSIILPLVIAMIILMFITAIYINIIVYVKTKKDS